MTFGFASVQVVKNVVLDLILLSYRRREAGHVGLMSAGVDAAYISLSRMRSLRSRHTRNAVIFRSLHVEQSELIVVRIKRPKDQRHVSVLALSKSKDTREHKPLRSYCGDQRSKAEHELGAIRFGGSSAQENRNLFLMLQSGVHCEESGRRGSGLLLGCVATECHP